MEITTKKKSGMYIEELKKQILEGDFGIKPENLVIDGASYICQTTRLPSSTTVYLNHYIILRVGKYFGTCVHTPDQLDMKAVSELSGVTLDAAINDNRLPVQIAAMDAYLGFVHPHDNCCSEIVLLPGGTALDRAKGRDFIIANKANIQPNHKVALIGVVNPLIEAINHRGGICLPCDLHLSETQWGDPIEKDMENVLDKADSVICTGMTLGNGTFDRVIQRVRERKIPLTIYAQTGSAIAAQFVGDGVTSLVAEVFPFSQFTTFDTKVYCYKY